MGQRDAFSIADVEKINKMYKCDNSEEPLDTRYPGVSNNIDEFVGEKEPTPISENRPNRPLNRPGPINNRPFGGLFAGLLPNRS